MKQEIAIFLSGRGSNTRNIYDYFKKAMKLEHVYYPRVIEDYLMCPKG